MKFYGYLAAMNGHNLQLDMSQKTSGRFTDFVISGSANVPRANPQYTHQPAIPDNNQSAHNLAGNYHSWLNYTIIPGYMFEFRKIEDGKLRMFIAG